MSSPPSFASHPKRSPGAVLISVCKGLSPWLRRGRGHGRRPRVVLSTAFFLGTHLALLPGNPAGTTKGTPREPTPADRFCGEMLVVDAVLSVLRLLSWDGPFLPVLTPSVGPGSFVCAGRDCFPALLSASSPVLEGVTAAAGFSPFFPGYGHVACKKRVISPLVFDPDACLRHFGHRDQAPQTRRLKQQNLFPYGAEAGRLRLGCWGLVPPEAPPWPPSVTPRCQQAGGEVGGEGWHSPGRAWGGGEAGRAQSFLWRSLRGTPAGWSSGSADLGPGLTAASLWPAGRGGTWRPGCRRSWAALARPW